MDIDYFFYYGKVAQAKEVSADLEMNLLQPKRTMFYFRSSGCEISDYENKPISLVTKILLKYSVIKAIATMNTYVTDGSNGTRDRRVLSSQNNVDIASKGSELDIHISYLPMYDVEQKDTLDLALGGL